MILLFFRKHLKGIDLSMELRIETYNIKELLYQNCFLSIQSIKTVAYSPFGRKNLQIRFLSF
ncbi:MAG: hypothetical protein DRQ02_13205, partial [Candidatus Latescibacterota bacterium]